jgi:hypothetical protein
VDDRADDGGGAPFPPRMVAVMSRHRGYGVRRATHARQSRPATSCLVTASPSRLLRGGVSSPTGRPDPHGPAVSAVTRLPRRRSWAGDAHAAATHAPLPMHARQVLTSIETSAPTRSPSPQRPCQRPCEPRCEIPRTKDCASRQSMTRHSGWARRLMPPILWTTPVRTLVTPCTVTPCGGGRSDP